MVNSINGKDNLRNTIWLCRQNCHLHRTQRPASLNWAIFTAITKPNNDTKEMKSVLFLISFIIIGLIPVQAQIQIQGTVMAYNHGQTLLPLSGAEVFWLDDKHTVLTDIHGRFNILTSEASSKLVVHYPNFRNDTLLVNRPNLGLLILKPEIELQEVIVSRDNSSIQRSLFDVQNVVTVDSREMLKAACCNLSESFETNPAVDVNIADAITGTKQIQMLGLHSPYLLITQDNIPSTRGASSAQGLSFIPGNWIESIQITKGMGSVVNGYESISGQINTTLRQPHTDQQLFLNLYANNFARFELNSRWNTFVTNKLSTGIFLHANSRTAKVDNNKDGFLDTPLSQQINILNRWQYGDPKKGWISFLNWQYLRDHKQTGEIHFSPKTDKLSTKHWGSEHDSDRFDISSKLGYVFPDLPYQSIGLQMAYTFHKQDAYYGLRTYDIQQSSFYGNIIFSSIIGSTMHKYKTGLSFMVDNYKERLNSVPLDRVDNAMGAYFEYSFTDLDKFSIVTGLRFDIHNRLHGFFSPRLHLRYAIWEKAAIRASIGRGKRSANIVAENQKLFNSSRQIRIEDSNGSTYGLQPEIAWNYGLSFTQKLYLNKQLMVFSVDFYRTQFENQVIVDWETPDEVSFYNLEGKSYSNSFQIDLSYELIQNLQLRATYKAYQVKADYKTGKQDKPLQPKQRFFANVSYQTVRSPIGRQWRFDSTIHWQSKQRIPRSDLDPFTSSSGSYSSSYALLNAQVTRVLSNTFEFYIGGENITNYTQNDPIVAADDPFGPHFDASMNYAPVLPGVYYIGIRYKLN